MVFHKVVLEILFLTFSSLFFSNVHGIDLNQAWKNENVPCFVPNQLANVNITWATSPRRYFYAAMSVLDLYSEGLKVSGKEPRDLPEDELYYDACVTYDLATYIDGGEMGGVATSFGGTETHFVMESADGFRTTNWRSLPPLNNFLGTVYITLTDNRTFLFMVTCREGKMSWKVVSTSERISKKTDTIVRKHAVSLGFKEENFTGLRYDSCPQYSRHMTTKNSKQ